MNKRVFLKNRKGWIRIVEAFIAITMLAIILIVLLNNSGVREDEVFSKVYNSEVFILRSVELNDTLREDVLLTSGVVNWEDAGFPQEVKDRIVNKTPSWLECVSNICPPGDPCLLDSGLAQGVESDNVYTQAVLITATTNPDIFNPRQLRLFCWEN